MREHPSYHLIKAQVQQKAGNPEESIKTLMAAMNLPGVQTQGNNYQSLICLFAHSVVVYLHCSLTCTCISKFKQTYLFTLLAPKNSNKKSKIQIQQSDRVSVYLGLVEAHRQAGNSVCQQRYFCHVVYIFNN